MLITHVKPSELWGKKVYDTTGNFLGEVVAIGSRRGVVRKVVVSRGQDGRPVRMVPPTETTVAGKSMIVPLPQTAKQPRLRLVQ